MVPYTISRMNPLRDDPKGILRHADDEAAIPVDLLDSLHLVGELYGLALANAPRPAMLVVGSPSCRVGLDLPCLADLPLGVVGHDPQHQHPEVLAVARMVEAFAARTPLQPGQWSRHLFSPARGAA